MQGRKIAYTEYPDWFIEELVEDRDKELAKSGLLPHSIRVQFNCTQHGVYNQRVSNHIDFKTMRRKSGCPICGKGNQIKAKKNTHNRIRNSYPDWFIDELASDVDKERARCRIIASGEILMFRCFRHGEYKQPVYDHIRLRDGKRLRGCPECAKLARANKTKSRRMALRPPFPDWFIDELYLKSDKQRAKDKTLSYGREKVQFYCPEHGVYIQAISDHISYKTGERKQGCPACGRVRSSNNRKEINRQKRPDYPNWFIDELAQEEDKIKALQKELTWSEKVEFNCPQHGVYSQRIDAHMDTKTFAKKQGCPKCGLLISKCEEEIFEFIKSLEPTSERRNHTLIKYPDSNRFLELDIYVPSKKIAIEYNGSYWHGELHKNDSSFHLNKFKLCSQHGVQLISIYDWDWKENTTKVKTFLRDKILPKRIIYGRCTECCMVSVQDARTFYTKYHLKGCGCHTKVSFGLFYKNDLVSVMTFSKPNFGNLKEIEWELTRYCVKPGICVVGGAEKLFNAFKIQFNPLSIVTYSDNDYFTGDVYGRLGFTLKCMTVIPYYWAKGNVFLSRQQCQVKILKGKYPELYDQAIADTASNKEDYIMHALGFYKVYRSGNKKWVWNQPLSAVT